jgi:hypothetical protein
LVQHKNIERIHEKARTMAHTAKETAGIPRERLDGPLRRGSVRKHVAAIHVSGKLTLLQRKLSNVLLLNAYDHLLTRPRHRIDAQTLCLMVGYNSNDIDTLKASLRSLAETTAEWDILGEDGEQEWGVSALLSFAKLKGGVCEYAYSPVLAEKLHDPKVFALINLDIQRRFASGHGLALYENCYRFVRTGSTGWWDLALFRRLMGVADSAYYESFKHLNAKIIKPAVAEVNRSANIHVTPEFRRESRTVVAVRFRIRQAEPAGRGAAPDLPGESSVLQQLLAMGIAERLARHWIGEHGEAYVARKLDYVAARAREGAIRTTVVRYLSAAIAGDYGAAPGGARAAAAPGGQGAAVVPLAAVRSPAADAEDAAERARSAARDAGRRARAAKLSRVLDAAARRNPTRRDADQRAFLGRLEHEIEREDFRRYGWRSALCARAIFAFWAAIEPDLFDGLDELAV